MTHSRHQKYYTHATVQWNIFLRGLGYSVNADHYLLLAACLQPGIAKYWQKLAIIAFTEDIYVLHSLMHTVVIFKTPWWSLYFLLTWYLSESVNSLSRNGVETLKLFTHFNFLNLGLLSRIQHSTIPSTGIQHINCSHNLIPKLPYSGSIPLNYLQLPCMLATAITMKFPIQSSFEWVGNRSSVLLHLSKQQWTVVH